MDDLGTVVAFMVLAVGVVLSRMISERAFRRLDNQMKIAIINEFSGMRIWNIVPVLAINRNEQTNHSGPHSRAFDHYRLYNTCHRSFWQHRYGTCIRVAIR